VTVLSLCARGLSRKKKQRRRLRSFLFRDVMCEICVQRMSREWLECCDEETDGVETDGHFAGRFRRDVCLQSRRQEVEACYLCG
jgi:hypothetical protein